MLHKISASFLNDLDIVCPKEHDGKLPLNFTTDIESAYAHALGFAATQPAITDSDLASLGNDLKAWRSHYQRLLQQYLAHLPCDDPLLGRVSLFGTMDYGRLETAHTRALTWLLGDREHGFGFQLLEALLRHILNETQIGQLHVVTVRSEAATDAGRIDVLAEGRWDEAGKAISWVMVIEAKIDSDEGEEQLSRYDNWLARYNQSTRIIRIFLTPEGRAARSGSAEWQALSFVDLASVFRRVGGLQDQPGYHYLRYYLTGVLRDVCDIWVHAATDCENPYAAVDYLKSVPGLGETDGERGQLR